MKNYILIFIAMMLCSATMFAQPSQKLTGLVATSSNPQSDPMKLVNEQDDLPSSPSIPTSTPNDGWNTWFADDAEMDLGGTFTVTDIYLFDANGNPPFRIEYWDADGNWELINEVTLDAYLQWIPALTNGNISTSKLRFRKTDQSASVFEVAIYGYNGTPPTGATLNIYPNNQRHDMNSHIVGVNRNAVKENTDACPYFDDLLDEYAAADPQYGTGRKLYRLGGSNIDGLVVTCSEADGTYNNDYCGYDFTQHFGSTGPYPYDDIQYFVDEADAMDADMMVGVNFGSGTPTQAGQVVQHFKDNDLLSKVGFFEIGNEMSGDWQLGHFDKACSPTEYATNAKPYIDQMRAVDPNIKISVEGAHSYSWGWFKSGFIGDNPANGYGDCGPVVPGGAPTIDALFSVLGDKFDYITFHGYSSWPLITPARDAEECANFNTVNDENEAAKRFLGTTPYFTKRIEDEILPAIEQAKITYGVNKDIRLANTETSSLWASAIHPNIVHSITEGIYTADNMLSAFKHNYASSTSFSFFHCTSFGPEFSCPTDFSTNLFFNLNTNSYDLKPSFKVQKMLALYLGDKVVEDSAMDIPKVGAYTSCFEQQTTVNYDKIGHLSTLDDDGTLYVLLLNRSTESVTLDVVPHGYTVQSASMKSLMGSSYQDSNPVETGFTNVADLSAVTLPKLSVNILKITSDVVCTDNDNDNVCIDVDCDDNDASVGAQQAPGTPCDDGDPNTTDTVIQADGCTCAVDPVGNCDVTVNASNSSVTISGITSASLELQIIGPGTNWMNQPICDGNCNNTETVSNLTEGNYVVKAINSGCYKQYNATIGDNPCDNQGGDNDNDNVCANVDCDDNDASVGAAQTPGTTCDDGNPNTNNDVIQADGCTCAGVPDGNDCEVIQVTPGSGSVSISNVASSLYLRIIGPGTGWEDQDICNGNCNSIETVPNLTSGTYTIKALGSDPYCYEDYNISVFNNKLAQLNENQRLLIFPNPIENDAPTLVLDSPEDEQLDIQIYNINSQLVHTQSVSTISGVNEITLDLQAARLVSGVYFVKVISPKYDYGATRFVKP